jgi:hypothetical protein
MIEEEMSLLDKEDLRLIKRTLFFLMMLIVLILIGSFIYDSFFGEKILLSSENVKFFLIDNFLNRGLGDYLFIYSFFGKEILFDPGDIVNVVIVDDAFEVGLISDSIIFSGPANSMQETQIPEQGVSQTGPEPFVILNFGNVNADVEVVSIDSSLYSDARSSLQFKIHDFRFDEVEIGSEYERFAQDCFDSGDNPLCFESSDCTNWCDINFDDDIFGGIDYSTSAIEKLKPYVSETGYGAIMHIKVDPHYSEPPGVKSTTVFIQGFESFP